LVCGLLLMMMLVSGCRTQRQLERASFTRVDSLVYIEKVKVDTLKIPAAQAQVFLDRPWTMDDGRWSKDDSPQIVAHDRQGPATITIYRESDGSLRAIAQCDSVNRLLISTMTDLYRSGQQDSQLVKEKVVYRLPPWLTLVAIIVGGATLLLVIIKVKSIIL
jgi:hypothetical protein